MDRSLKKLRYNKTKKNKNSKVKKFAYFFKRINFKLIKTTRNQVKYHEGL